MICTGRVTTGHNLSRFTGTKIGYCGAWFGSKKRMLERDAAVDGATSYDIWGSMWLRFYKIFENMFLSIWSLQYLDSSIFYVYLFGII